MIYQPLCSKFIVNQVKEGLSKPVLEILDKAGLELAGTIPEDKTIYEYDLNGQATIKIPEDNEAVKAAFAIFDKII